MSPDPCPPPQTPVGFGAPPWAQRPGPPDRGTERPHSARVSVPRSPGPSPQEDASFSPARWGTCTTPTRRRYAGHGGVGGFTPLTRAPQAPCAPSEAERFASGFLTRRMHGAPWTHSGPAAPRGAGAAGSLHSPPCRSPNKLARRSGATSARAGRPTPALHKCVSLTNHGLPTVQACMSRAPGADTGAHPQRGLRALREPQGLGLPAVPSRGRHPSPKAAHSPPGLLPGVGGDPEDSPVRGRHGAVRALPAHPRHPVTTDPPAVRPSCPH